MHDASMWEAVVVRSSSSKGEPSTSLCAFDSNSLMVGARKLFPTRFIATVKFKQDASHTIPSPILYSNLIFNYPLRQVSGLAKYWRMKGGGRTMSLTQNFRNTGKRDISTQSFSCPSGTSLEPAAMNTTTSIPGIINTFIPFSKPANWLLAALIFPIFSFYLLRDTSDGKLYDLGGIPILTTWTFFSKRYDFMRENLKRSGGLPFRFRVLQHRVIALTGASARKAFFNDPGLSIEQGHRLLVGGSLLLENADVDVDKPEVVGSLSNFIKRLSVLLRKERVAEILPLFLEDIHDRMSEWGTEGMINPFKEVYDLAFQMTVRMATCRELSQDKAAVEKVAELFWALKKSATPTALLLPWIPSPSKKMNRMASAELYNHIVKYVHDRRAAGAPTADAIDILIQNGESDPVIVQTILGIVFAGIENTGIVSSWALLYLGLNPTWRHRAISELKTLFSRSCDPLSPEPLYKKLAAISPSAWEQDLPSIDLIIRETIRISRSMTLLRRNVVKDMEMQGVKIQKGDFLAYSVMDVHMNEDIYTEPEKFDPARFEIGREEDKKVYYGFLGWGTGRHPCAGMKIAKLEIKIVLAMALLGYQYGVVDETGVKTDYLPKPDQNDIQARPLGKPVYLKFNRTKA